MSSYPYDNGNTAGIPPGWPAPQMMPDPGGQYPDPRGVHNPVSNSSEARFDRIAERITKLEAVVKTLPPAFALLGAHLGRIENSFGTVQVVCNDFHSWAYRFLDAYNERHPAPPLLYPPNLPPGFALPQEQTSAVDKANRQQQDLLAESALLRKEYDFLEKKREELSQENLRLANELANLKATPPKKKAKPKRKPAAK